MALELTILVGRRVFTGHEWIRVFPTPPFPFVIFYTVGYEEIIIRNVRYAGRKRVL